MKNLTMCRRTFIAFTGILACVALGIFTHSADASTAIALITASLAGANAYEGAAKSKTYQNPAD